MTAADVMISEDGKSLRITMPNTKDKVASLTTKLEMPSSKIGSVSTEPVKVDHWRTVKVFATQTPSYYASQFYIIGKHKKNFFSL